MLMLLTQLIIDILAIEDRGLIQVERKIPADSGCPQTTWPLGPYVTAMLH